MSDFVLPSDAFYRIDHFVVLMLENRSFDFVLGHLQLDDPKIDGIKNAARTIPADPYQPAPSPIALEPAESPAMLYDPPHEYPDVQLQLFAPDCTFPVKDSFSPAGPPRMQGFVKSAARAAQDASTPGKPVSPRSVMEYLSKEQVPVLSTLARQYAVFNYWHSSIPGPTWPNRFFVHASTSGGLSDSPGTDAILDGFEFASGTIYDRLEEAGRSWSIYYTGFPQAVGIRGLRSKFLGSKINPFRDAQSIDNFREMEDFEADVRSGHLTEYTFIEPDYATGSNYADGDSMHPLNDIRKGEKLVGDLYRILRASAYWESVMFLVVFDEHGGFYDHVIPPAAVPTGDDSRYATPGRAFGFDRMGVRVPAIAVSAFTERGTVIGSTPSEGTTLFDHTSIPATLGLRFQMKNLTGRERAAHTLEVAINRESPRCTDEQAPLKLPDPAPITAFQKPVALPPGAAPSGLLSEGQQSMVNLAAACNREISPPAQHEAIKIRRASVRTHEEAKAYLKEVEDKIRQHRKKRTH
jgi:phospholipase C